MNSSSRAVSNNLIWAILSTLFCCLPLGIVSIVYAAKVDGLAAAGDLAGAQEAADKAKTWACGQPVPGWCWWSSTSCSSSWWVPAPA